MGEVAMDRTDTTAVESILKDELARGDLALRGVAPVISHLLASPGHTLVSEAIVARLRGMLADIARQLLALGLDRGVTPDPHAIDALANTLRDDAGLLDHLYALAMEGHLTQRLELRSSVDPILSPLLQELIASDQAAVSELAMNALAAQSRFVQSQRRMELPLNELPAEIFARVLDKAAQMESASPSTSRAMALTALKQDFDEGAGRLGLLARLVSAMKSGALAALELDHAGFALFVSAISGLTRQDRDLAIVACHERQAARLALSLRAAGQGEEAIERQFLLLEPAEMLPLGIGNMSPDKALSLLSQSQAAR